MKELTDCMTHLTRLQNVSIELGSCERITGAGFLNYWKKYLETQSSLEKIFLTFDTHKLTKKEFQDFQKEINKLEIQNPYLEIAYI